MAEDFNDFDFKIWLIYTQGYGSSHDRSMMLKHFFSRVLYAYSGTTATM